MARCLRTDHFKCGLGICCIAYREGPVTLPQSSAKRRVSFAHVTMFRTLQLQAGRFCNQSITLYKASQMLVESQILPGEL